MLTIGLATLAIILKLGLRNISEREKSLIFLNIYTFTTVCVTLFSFLSLFFVLFCFFFVLFFLSFSFHLLFSFSLTLFIGTYYCLNYNSLLLHFIITHLTSHLSLSSIIFIVSDPNYRHLSLP